MQDLFPTIVYLLCFFTSSACAWMLGRSYRRTGARLLLWSGLCFFFLAANNLVLVVDLVLLPGNDLRLGRLLFTLAALGTLLFGFVWDLEEER